MSTSSPHLNRKRLPTRTCTGEKIRQQVDERHWELFELRLKNSTSHNDKENYTKTNDYRIKDRLKQSDQQKSPIEPDQRWKRFCSQVTDKPNETNRVMSIFQNVWTNNWHSKQQYELENTRKATLNTKSYTFMECLSRDEHDRKVISSILRQGI